MDFLLYMYMCIVNFQLLLQMKLYNSYTVIHTSTGARFVRASTCACSTRSLCADKNEICDLYVICMEQYSQ